MQNVTFYSQAKQDQFVFDLLVKNRGLGYFLDIGAAEPIHLNNTYALEQIGWTGTLVEKDPYYEDDLRASRTSEVIIGNALSIDWGAFPRKAYDYLSLDIDADTPDVLKKLLEAGFTFRCATIEHDAYRYGDGPRTYIRDLMQMAGYNLLLGNISVTPGHPFEDWWIAPSLSKIMFNLDPYLSQDTTILPDIPCIPCGKTLHK